VEIGVFVLGFSRSGKSPATRLINLLGVRVPREEDLVPPSAKNPTGYWESMSLVAFNTRVLAAVGSDMQSPVVFEPRWEDDSRLNGLRHEARGAVRQAFPTAPWVWKDPRNCLTLSFWRSVLGVRPVVVLVDRNPLEIAACSLRARGDNGKIYTLGALGTIPPSRARSDQGVTCAGHELWTAPFCAARLVRANAGISYARGGKVRSTSRQ